MSGSQGAEIVHQGGDVVGGFQQDQFPAATEVVGRDAVHPVGQFAVGQGDIGGVHRRARTESAQVSDESVPGGDHFSPVGAAAGPDALPRLAETTGETAGVNMLFGSLSEVADPNF